MLVEQSCIQRHCRSISTSMRCQRVIYRPIWTCEPLLRDLLSSLVANPFSDHTNATYGQGDHKSRRWLLANSTVENPSNDCIGRVYATLASHLRDSSRNRSKYLWNKNPPTNKLDKKFRDQSFQRRQDLVLWYKQAARQNVGTGIFQVKCTHR